LIGPRALLIELDGTLVDSRRDIAESCNAALVAHGLPPLEAASIVGMVGDGARALVARALSATGSTLDVDVVLATFQAHYGAHACIHTTLMPGAQALLACGVPCAVLTNKPRPITLQVLETLSIRVVDVWAGDGVLKPAPDGVLALSKRLAIPPADVWVVGDGPQDIGAGKAAGAFTVGVLGGIAHRDTLLAAKPDLVVASLDELTEIISSRRLA
jgi:phosphoglycolate phosphatase